VPGPAPEPTSPVLRGLVFANAALGVVALIVVLVAVRPSAAGAADVAERSNLISALLMGTVLFTFLPLAFVPDRREHLRRRRLDVVIAAVCIADLVFSDALVNALASAGSLLSAGQITLIAVFFRQALVMIGLGAHALRLSRRFATVELAPGWILVGSFFGLIGLGALLLQHPAATRSSISWVDSLFTAASAVTVTGLTVVDTGSQFTPLGQGIILVLLQVGGLGVMTLTYFVVVLVGGDLTARDRMMIREILTERRVAEIAVVLRRVVWMTLVLELIGAVVLAAAMDVSALGGRRVWFPALFHAVSAFCNAGFSVYDDGLQDPVMAGSAVQVTMMLLIVVGGLGFPVLRELNQWLWAWRGKLGGWSKARLPTMSLHTRLVLTTTVVLVVGGAVVIYATEFWFADGPSSGSRPLTALFHSVTARTAGFSTTDVGAAAPATVLVLVLLMVIGGSPASTAGGIRTTTFALASANVWRAMRGRKRLALFSSPIPDRLVSRAFAVVSAAMIWIGLGTFVLVLLEPEHDVVDLLFELVSAFSTVGLSRGITSSLSGPAQGLLIVTMFAGRVGILVFLSTILPVRKARAPLGEDDASGVIV
jgi:potassium uptake TrkH family protein